MTEQERDILVAAKAYAKAFREQEKQSSALPWQRYSKNNPVPALTSALLKKCRRYYDESVKGGE